MRDSPREALPVPAHQLDFKRRSIRATARPNRCCRVRESLRPNKSLTSDLTTNLYLITNHPPARPGFVLVGWWIIALGVGDWRRYTKESRFEYWPHNPLVLTPVISISVGLASILLGAASFIYHASYSNLGGAWSFMHAHKTFTSNVDHHAFRHP